MRLFVALDIDEAIQQRLDDYVRTLLPRFPGVRFVRSSNYHITLQFLGEVPKAEAVRERLRQVHLPAFELSVRGVGFFPDARAPESSGPASSRPRSPLWPAASGSRSKRWALRRRASFIPISRWRATAREGRVRCAASGLPTHLHSLPGMWLRVRPPSSVQ